MNDFFNFVHNRINLYVLIVFKFTNWRRMLVVVKLVTGTYLFVKITKLSSLYLRRVYGRKKENYSGLLLQWIVKY